MKILIFDIFGDYAHFKKFYTTSSPLTFSFPPPTTIKGMLAAIIGVDKTEYLDVFDKSSTKIALKILNPIKKIRLGLNHINTKDNYWVPINKNKHGARTQIKTEFVSGAAYRVFVTHKERSIFEELQKNLEQHKTYFTISLGLSELLSDFEFIGVKDFERKTNKIVDIESILPQSIVCENGIEFELGKKYFKEKLPINMNSERIVENYEDIIFEIEGQTIKSSVKEHWESKDGEKIILM